MEDASDVEEHGFGCRHRVTVIATEIRHGSRDCPWYRGSPWSSAGSTRCRRMRSRRSTRSKMQYRRARRRRDRPRVRQSRHPVARRSRSRSSPKRFATRATTATRRARASRSCAWRSPTSTSASSAWQLDFETEVCSTIGAKEGFSHLMLTLVGPGDTALVPSPSYPIHIWGPILAGAARALRAHGPRPGLLREPARRVRAGVAPPARDRHVVPAQPHHRVRRSRRSWSGSSRSHASARSSSCTTSRTPTSASTGTSRRRSCRCPARRTSRSSCTRSRSRSRWPGGAWASSSATPRSSPRSRSSSRTSTTARSSRSRSRRPSR